MNNLYEYIFFIGAGIPLSLALLTGGFTIGLIVGTLLALLRYQGIAKVMINSFISLIRGTPVILQLSFVYFALPALIGLKLNILLAGILTFGLNSSAYIAEIFRAGIENIPKGQFEAAKTLAIPPFYMWKDIILPQVLKNILPALMNEMIALLKETALISTIGGMDLMRRSESIAAEQFTYFMPLCIAGFYYYALVLVMGQLAKLVEKRGSYVSY